MSLPLDGGRLGRDSIVSEPKQESPPRNEAQRASAVPGRSSLTAPRESQWRLSKEQKWEELANLDREQVYM